MTTFGYMKRLLLCLLAITITLGVGCKKEESKNVEVKKEFTAPLKTANAPLPTYPEGANQFPHNTGVCNCGKYAGCHPSTYMTSWYDSNGMGHFMVHITQPGQTTFPGGATFPGNQ